LVPIYIKLVDKEEDLGDETERNLGGFGSTGI
jgi:dUTPase